MTDTATTNGSTWWTEPAEETHPVVAAVEAPAVETRIPPPPPPPAPTPAQPAPTATAPPVQPTPQPEAWPVNPPVAPPLAERAQPPARQPRAEVEATEGVAATIRGRWGERGRRYRWAMGAVGVTFVLLAGNAALGRLGSAVGDAAGKAAASSNDRLAASLTEKEQPTQVMMNVTNPLAWLPCPLTADAKGMISYDPPGQNDILSAARAGEVDRQAQKLLVDHKPAELRLTQPDSTHLWVFVNNPTIGTALIDCTNVGTTDNTALAAATPPTTPR